MTRAQTLLLAHASIVSGPGDAIKASLLQTDAELMADPTVHSQRSGTTAVVVLLCKNQLWVGNVGDSRAVLGTLDAAGALVPHDLTIDHKPDDEGEFERITTCGGLVSEATPEDGPARVWFAPNSGHTSGPGLAMSRSIGDHRSRELGVIPEPDIRLGEVALLHSRDKLLGAEHAVLVDIHCVEDVHQEVELQKHGLGEESGEDDGLGHGNR